MESTAESDEVHVHPSKYISKHKTLTNAGLLLAQRRRRWANIKPALGQRLVFAGIMVDRHLMNVGPRSETLAQDSIRACPLLYKRCYAILQSVKVTTRGYLTDQFITIH